MSDDSAAPLLRIVRGKPTDAELAAIVAVVAARSGVSEPAPKPLRQPLSAWVASGLVKGTRTRV